jgi:DNA-binding MarR family transcriptional regulator
MTGKTIPIRLAELTEIVQEEAPTMNVEEYRAFLFIADHEGTIITQVQQHVRLPQSTTSRAIKRLGVGKHRLIVPQKDGRQTFPRSW